MNCLDRIDESSRHLLYLIDNILDMAKIDAGNFELAPYKFSFTKTVEQIVADISAQAGAKKQRFSFKVDPAIPDSLVADGHRLGQVLFHLLSNGVKFTPEGGTISFSALKLAPEPPSPDGDECVIRFEVKDSGIGISAELKERLGNAFEQMDNSITRIYGGTGLGLAISKRIVQMMDGSIEVDSPPGGGSCFICTVKVKLNKDITLAENDSKSAVTLAGRRILVVDDVEINRDIIFGFLEDTGAVLDGARDGIEAVEMFSKNSYDVVLMDLHMPGMDGFEAARRIRNSEAPGKNLLPIIAVTADTGGDVVSRCLKAGMNGHVGKPVDCDLLINAIVGNLAPGVPAPGIYSNS
jgi:CheY-like chemotaxis protein